MNLAAAVKPSALALLALQNAVGELGQAEVPRGSNRGPRIEAYLASVGLAGGNPWCQAFVHWCYKSAAIRMQAQCPVKKTGSVMACWNATDPTRRISKADARTRPGIVAPGAQFIMDFGGGIGHTGIVERIDGDVIHTIEGNSNDEGSREGFEVCRRTRHLTDKLLKGFINYQ